MSKVLGAGMLGAFFGAFMAIIGVIFIVWFVLQVIAWWKIFTKAGEKGWKAIIPFYNLYVQIKLTWSKKFFWIILVAGIVTGICQEGVKLGCPSIVSSIVGAIAAIVFIVLVIIAMYRLSKSFGHGGGWTVGLVFLETIFILMIAFGKSEYKGNVYLEEKNK